MYITGNRDFCSTAQPNEKSKYAIMSIPKQASKSISFPIVPIKVGTTPVSVIALVPLLGGDGVTRQLLVKVSKVHDYIKGYFHTEPCGYLQPGISSSVTDKVGTLGVHPVALLLLITPPPPPSPPRPLPFPHL